MPVVKREAGRSVPLWQAVTLVVLSACAAHPPEPPLPQLGSGGPSRVIVDRPNGQSSTTVSVLTYNVAGLPWPAKSGRAPALEAIGRELGWLHARGRAPDVVLLQEAFMGEVGRLIELSGYANFVRGPASADRSVPIQTALVPDSLESPQRLKGEGWPKWLNSGLYVLSDFPIIERWSRPFAYCAGLDCLANKGVLLVRLEIPGLPVPLDVFTIHMNSRNASGVDEARSLLAHNLQADELEAFLGDHHEHSHPLIFAGDFNVRRAADRLDYVAARGPYEIVSQYCADKLGECGVRSSYDGDAPWEDTQDMHGFHDGDGIKIEPIRVEAMFDAPVEGSMLSDHDGYLVDYRLTWRRALEPGASH